MLGLDRITFDPNIMGGQACIRGMRIPVSLVVNLVANSKPVEEILEEYPDLEPEDIRQSLLYAKMMKSNSKKILKLDDLCLITMVLILRITYSQYPENLGFWHIN